MNKNTEKALKLFKNGDYTCVLYKGAAYYTTMQSGIKPLVDLLDCGKNCKGYSAVDKIVGKAAAMLYVVMGVVEVYAEVMSEAAESVLSSHGIAAFPVTLVPAIMNRQNTDICPMEKAVENVDDPSEAVAVLTAKVRRAN